MELAPSVHRALGLFEIPRRYRCYVVVITDGPTRIVGACVCVSATYVDYELVTRVLGLIALYDPAQDFVWKVREINGPETVTIRKSSGGGGRDD